MNPFGTRPASGDPEPQITRSATVATEVIGAGVDGLHPASRSVAQRRAMTVMVFPAASLAPRPAMLAIMNTPLLVVAAIFVGIAAVLHGYIFSLESLTWTRPRTWKIFGIASQGDADTIKPMAYNQGFYNLFLGVEAALGVILLAVNVPVAVTLIVVGAGSMVLASLVLLFSAPASRRSAMVQGVAPLLGLVFLLLAAVV